MFIPLVRGWNSDENLTFMKPFTGLGDKETIGAASSWSRGGSLTPAGHLQPAGGGGIAIEE